MMNNANKPAMPQSATKDGYACNYGNETDAQVPTGLTKREMFAMHAMQGILSNSGGVIQANSMSGTGWCNYDANGLAELSLECADALLSELEK